MLFAVVQKKLEILSPWKRGPLTHLAGAGIYAAGPHVNREHLGVLAEKLSRERAEKLVAALRMVRVDADVCAMEQLAPHPRSMQIRRAACVERGFVVQDMYWREHVHEWQSVLLLSAAMVRLKREVSARGHTGAGRGYWAAVGKRTITKTMTRWVLDIYTPSHAPHGHASRGHASHSHAPHYRIMQDQFNYHSLGKRRSVTDSWHNLQLFAADLDKFATHAARTEGFLTLRRGGTTNVYPNLKTLDEESRWHLQQIKRA